MGEKSIVFKRTVYVLSGLTIVFLFYNRLRLIFSHALDLDGTEFATVHYLQLLFQGHPLYRNPCEFPFLAELYFPLYHYVLYFFCNVIGFTDDTDPHKIYILARSFSLLCMFVNVFVIYRIFKLLNFSFLYFTIAAVFYLLLITGHFYAIRPDAFKVTLFSCFLFATIRYLFYDSRLVYLIVATLVALTAILFKQDSVVHIYLLLGGCLLYLRNRKSAYLLTSVTVGFIALLGGCYLIFGPPFFSNTILFNIQVTKDVFKTFSPWVVLFSIVRTAPFLLGTIYCYRYASRNTSKQSLEYFIPVIALVFFITVHLMIFRGGAYLNYTFETLLLIILSTAFFVRNNEQFFITKQKYFCALGSVYLVFLFTTNFFIHSYTYSPGIEKVHQAQYKSITDDQPKVQDVIQDDVVFFLNPAHVIFFHKQNIIYGYEMHFDRLVETLHGIPSSTRLLFVTPEKYDAYFAEGKVQYLIADDKELSKEVIKKYYRQFSPYKSFDFFTIYRNKSLN